MVSTSARMSEPNAQSDPEVRNIDYVEFYVGNACQAMHFYRSVFGLSPIAYAGLETGVKDRTSFVLQMSNVRIIVTTALEHTGPIAEHVSRHGDGVKDIALTVPDAKRAFHAAVARGARPIMEPIHFEDDGGVLTKATVAACGDTVHSFIERDSYARSFLPGYRSLNFSPAPGPACLAAIDHIAIGVERGTLDTWVGFYEEVLGFRVSHVEDVATEYTAMNSKVVESRNTRVKFPLMEPASGRRRSQIDEYLHFYGGAGVQHVALLTGNIVDVVRSLRANGIEFLRIPPSYYAELEQRVGKIDEDIMELRDLNILVDRDEWGYLMQVFTKPLQGRPTLFMEIIQRKGARGFGGNNIRALFEAVEREQVQRNTL